MDYCSIKDVHDFGLPAGATPNAARQVSSVDTVGDSLTLNEHGLDTDDPFKLRAGPGGSLPAPLLSGTTYYAIAVDENTFQVSASPGGPAINLTTSGGAVMVVLPRKTDKSIFWASRIIDDAVPAHAVPFLSPVPETIRLTCAELAAWKDANRAGVSNGQSVMQMIDFAQKRIARWAAGVPVRDFGATPPANIAVTATVPTAPSDWAKIGGVC